MFKEFRNYFVARFLDELGLQKEVDLATQLYPEEKRNDALSTEGVCCAQFMVSSQAIRLRSLDFWTNIQKKFHRKSFQLVVEEVATRMRKEDHLSAGTHRVEGFN